MLSRIAFPLYTNPKVMPFEVLITTTRILDLSIVQTSKTYERTEPMSVTR